MVIGLERGANDLQMVQLMPLPPNCLCFIKIQNGLSFWHKLIQLVVEKVRCCCGCRIFAKIVESFPSISLLQAKMLGGTAKFGPPCISVKIFWWNPSKGASVNGYD